MRQMTYEEIVELSKTDLKEALREARIRFENDRQNGEWAGLYIQLLEEAT